MNEILEFAQKYLDPSGFLPAAQGGTVDANGWRHAVPAMLICLAHLAIFAELIYFIRRRRGVRHAAMFFLLGAFILTGGIICLLESLTFWRPAAPWLPLGKAAAALVSLVMAAALLRMVPTLLALRDPTEFQHELAQRRRTEMELRKVHSQLEGVIELRTAELAHKTQEMEQFVNTVSHDLKNPVVTSLGLIGMLREDVQAGRVEETLDSANRIERSLTRMRQFIEDLLNLSRVGRIPFELAKVDTLNLVQTIAEEFKPRLAEIGAKLEIREGMPRVTADARWLREVFENLITNAIKYGCDNPQPVIAVGCCVQGGETRLYVHDNGRGIAQSDHAKVFEPFKRLRSDKEGSGMGLAIVQRIIKMHGWRIWVESAPGSGATFWIVLSPAAAGSIEQPQPVRAVA